LYGEALLNWTPATPDKMLGLV